MPTIDASFLKIEEILNRRLTSEEILIVGLAYGFGFRAGMIHEDDSEQEESEK